MRCYSFLSGAVIVAVLFSIPVMITQNCATAAQNETGLELRYTFEGNSGTQVLDASGHKRHGKIIGTAQREKQGQSMAFVFDGKTRIECGKILPEKMRFAGTVEAWGRMDVVGGSFFSCHTDDGNKWPKKRLRLGTITWNDSSVIAVIGKGPVTVGEFIQEFRSDVTPGKWDHWVMTWDSLRFRLYRNGILLADKACGDMWPKVKDVPCYVGYGSANPMHYKGRLGEVSVYSQALPPEKVAQHFKAGAKRLGIEELLKARTSCVYDHEKRQMIAQLDLSDITPLPANASVTVSLRDKKENFIAKKTASLQPDTESLELAFSTESLSAGEYLVSTEIVNKDGLPLGKTLKQTWYYQDWAARAARDKNVRILNNMVFEILRKENLKLKRANKPIEWKINLPYKCWVHVSAEVKTTGRSAMSISIDTGMRDSIIHFNSGKAPRQEGVRFLDAGEHTITAWGVRLTDDSIIREMTIRVIPEMIFAGVPNSSVEMGYLDFDFLEKDVLPNITSLVGEGTGVDYPRLRIWKAMGRRLYQEQNIPTRDNPKDMPRPLTADYAYKWWTEGQGFADPLFDGVIADEFIGSGNGAHIIAYNKAIQRIAANPEYRNKSVHIWGTEMYNPSDMMDMLKTVQKAGYKICWELYKAECTTEEEMDKWLKGYLKRTMAKWDQGYPGVTRYMIPALATFSIVHIGVDAWPQTDFKVHLDKQFHYFANAPEFFGLFGVSNWIGRYTNEEYVRWYGRLARHYCIEGKRNLLSEEYGYKYCPGIILNSDFSEKLKHWNTDQAEPGSITTGQIGYLGSLVGYWAPVDAGQTYAAMQRSDKKPNILSQALRNVTPGKCYSVKITAVDLDDALAAKSGGKGGKAAPEIGVRIEGAERVEDRCLNVVKTAVKSRKNVNVRSIRYVFRAKKDNPTLIITDWPNGNSPGGPVGRRIAINCVQVAPYFE